MNDLIAVIEARFASGNSVPVERAHITADEWAQLRFAAKVATFLDERVTEIEDESDPDEGKHYCVHFTPPAGYVGVYSGFHVSSDKSITDAIAMAMRGRMGHDGENAIR